MQTVSSRLQETDERIQSGTICPNQSDKINHVYKISCGAGKHSIGVPVLKTAIQALLKRDNYDHYPLFDDGVFLVRFAKN